MISLALKRAARRLAADRQLPLDLIVELEQQGYLLADLEKAYSPSSTLHRKGANHHGQ